MTAIHAAVWARAGRPDRAFDMLRIALRLDLDDVTGTRASGPHVATFGGVHVTCERPLAVRLGHGGDTVAVMRPGGDLHSGAS